LQFTFIPGGALLAGTLAVPSVALKKRKKIVIVKTKDAESEKQGIKDPQIPCLRTCSISAFGSWW
jgi:hypothetical protein